MSKTEYWKWECDTRLEKGGHRVFRDARDPFKAPELRRWALADNSGSWPHTTDDGVLWLDFSLPLEVDLRGEFGVVRYPLLAARDDDRESGSCGGLDALVTLRELFPHWRVTVSPRTRRVVEVLAPLIVKLPDLTIPVSIRESA